MKTTLALALAASLALGGCALFRRSPAWDAVVQSRSHYSDAQSAGAKDGYINHLHRVLTDAGIAHKVVTYQFHFHNVYREEGVQTATAVLYRDETTPRNPWWVMDEYHHVPVWLPNWALDAQLEFFIQRPVEVLAVKEYAVVAARLPRLAVATHQPAVASAAKHPQHRPMAHAPKVKKHRTLFVSVTRSHSARTAKPPVAKTDSDPLTATSLTGHSTSASDSGSSVDREKVNEVRQQLLNRNQGVKLRSE